MRFQDAAVDARAATYAAIQAEPVVAEAGRLHALLVQFPAFFRAGHEGWERLERIRTQRDDATVAQLLDGVRAAAESDQNVMPAIMDAVEAYATVGEVCGVLKDVFGTYREPVRF